MVDTAVKDDNNENNDKHADCMTISLVEIDEKMTQKEKTKNIYKYARK